MYMMQKRGKKVSGLKITSLFWESFSHNFLLQSNLEMDFRINTDVDCIRNIHNDIAILEVAKLNWHAHIPMSALS